MLKGQITLFFILGGVLLLFVLVFLFLFNKSSIPEDFSPDSNIVSAENFVKQCFELSLDESMINLYSSTFFINSSKVVFDSENVSDFADQQVPVLVDADTSNLLSLDYALSFLEENILDKYNSCVDFSVFDDEGYVVDNGLSQVNVTFSSDGIDVLFYPNITLSKDDAETSFDPVKSHLSNDSLRFYEFLKNFSDAQVEDFGYFHLGALAHLARVQDYGYQLYYLDDSYLVVINSTKDKYMEKGVAFWVN